MKRLKFPKNTQHFVMLFLLLVLSFVAMKDLLKPGFYESHDGIIHVMRLAHFDQALHEGQFPVRWLPTWMGGYGSPVFNFNWSLPYYFASFTHLLHISYEDSFKIILVLTYLLSAVCAYIFVFEMFNDYPAAFTAAVLYVWVPYRFTEIFIRGAIGEACAFLFLPLIFWLILRLSKKESWIAEFFLVLSWTLFILTHNLIAFLSIPIYVAYVLWLGKFLVNKWHWFIRIGLLLALSFGLAAWFWFPATIELKEINYSRGYGEINNQFLKPFVLFNSPWRYAYSTPAHPDFSMSFQLGIIHWLVIIAVMMQMFIYKSIKRDSKSFSYQTGVWYVGILVISILLTLEISRPLYQIIPLARVIGFPWRLLTFTTFAISILGGVLITELKKTQLKYAATLMLVLLSLYFYISYARIVSWSYTASDQEYLTTLKTNVQYLPDIEYLPLGAQYLPVLEQQGDARPNPLLFAERPGVTITSLNRKSLVISAIIKSENIENIHARQFYFPGWILWIDGRETSLQKDQYGLLLFQLPQGKHQIILQFTNTWIRSLANGLSLVSLVVWILLCIWRIHQKNSIKTINTYTQ